MLKDSTLCSSISIGDDNIQIRELDMSKGYFIYRIITGDVNHTSHGLYSCIRCAMRAAIASYKRYSGHRGKMPKWSTE